MNVFVIEGYIGKAIVMETLLHTYSMGDSSNNIGFALEDSSVDFHNEVPLYHIGWDMIRNNTIPDLVMTICNIASSHKRTNIFVYTNYLRNSEILKDLIKAFKTIGSPLHHVFIFCRPNLE